MKGGDKTMTVTKDLCRELKKRNKLTRTICEFCRCRFTCAEKPERRLK